MKFRESSTQTLEVWGGRSEGSFDCITLHHCVCLRHCGSCVTTRTAAYDSLALLGVIVEITVSLLSSYPSWGSPAQRLRYVAKGKQVSPRRQGAALAQGPGIDQVRSWALSGCAADRMEVLFLPPAFCGVVKCWRSWPFCTSHTNATEKHPATITTLST